MAKIDKASMASRANAAASAGRTDLPDRFDKAEQVVRSQPTGFSEPSPPTVAGATAHSSPVALFVTRAEERGTREPYQVVAPIGLIDENPFNARWLYKPETINQMATSIKASGQLMPGIATIRNGRFVLAAGHYRQKGIKVAGLPTMKLEIHEGLTDQELYQISYKENAERTEQTPLDDALAWRDLLKKGVFANESEIAENTGKSLPTVNKTLAILKLTDAVLEVVKQTPTEFGLSVLYELVLLETQCGTDVALAMAKKIEAGDAGRKETQELRTRLAAPKERKRKENSRQYKIKVDGVETGFIKEWDSGKVGLEVVLLNPKDREALVEELKRRFNLAD